MKRLFKYGMYALLALAAPMAFQSCNDDKDIVMIDEDLPLILNNLYMVGDATPAGWAIDNPTPMTKDENDKFIFTYTGKLSVGEVKFPLSKGDWGATFIYAPAAGTEINENGVASDKFEVRKGGDDNKWKVTKAGVYALTLNLRDFTFTAKYEGAEPAKPFEPIVTATLGMVGDEVGWTPDAPFALTKVTDNPLVFNYTGHLKEGTFKLVPEGTTDWNGSFVHSAEADVEINGINPVKKGMANYPGGDDNKWKVTAAGNYSIDFNLSTGEVTVKSFTADPSKSVWETETLYAIGNAVGTWIIGKGVAFDKTGDNTFVYAGELKAGALKFMTTNTGGFDESKDFFYASAADVAISENGVAADELVEGNGKSTDNKFNVTKAGNYVLTIDMKNHKISAEYVGAVEGSLATYKAAMMGNATPSGWDEKGTAFTKATSSPLTYTWEGELKAGNVKFMYSKTQGFAGPMIYAPAANTEVTTDGLAGSKMVVGENGDAVMKADNQWSVKTAGKYKITLNFSDKTVKFEYLGA